MKISCTMREGMIAQYASLPRASDGVAREWVFQEEPYPFGGFSRASKGHDLRLRLK